MRHLMLRAAHERLSAEISNQCVRDVVGRGLRTIPAVHPVRGFRHPRRSSGPWVPATRGVVSVRAFRAIRGAVSVRGFRAIRGVLSVRAFRAIRGAVSDPWVPAIRGVVPSARSEPSVARFCFPSL